MYLSDCSKNQLMQKASGEGLKYTIGPFNICLHSDISSFVSLFSKIYSNLPLLNDDVVFDFHLQIHRPKSFRRWWNQQAVFQVDGITPFEPYPLTHAFPLAEWGLNWCIGLSSHQYLMLHSAVLDYHGQALIMPALPGSGKSTLCTALMLRGWRLLSDEFGLIDPASHQFLPLPRAIPLKNQSIPVISQFSENVVMGPVFEGTRKGDIAHVAPDRLSIEQQSLPSEGSVIVFPRYNPDISCKLEKTRKSHAFNSFTSNSFNYYLSQETGFNVLTQIVKQCDTYTLEFNNLDEAVKVLTELMDRRINV